MANIFDGYDRQSHDEWGNIQMDDGGYDGSGIDAGIDWDQVMSDAGGDYGGYDGLQDIQINEDGTYTYTTPDGSMYSVDGDGNVSRPDPNDGRNGSGYDWENNMPTYSGYGTSGYRYGDGTQNGSGGGNTATQNNKGPSPLATAGAIAAGSFAVKGLSDLMNDYGDLDSAFNAGSGIAETAWKDWLTNKADLTKGVDDYTSKINAYSGKLDGVMGDIDASTGRATAGIQSAIDGAGAGMSQYFDPAYNEYKAVVDKLGNQGYIDSQRAQRMEEQAALADQAEGQVMRRAAGMGAGSGAAMAALAAGAADRAKAKVAAATKSDNDIFSQRLSALNGFGQLGAQGASLTNQIAATKMQGNQAIGSLGLQAGAAKNNVLSTQASLAKAPLDAKLGLSTAGLSAANTVGGLYNSNAANKVAAIKAKGEMLTDIGKGAGWAMDNTDKIKTAWDSLTGGEA